MEDKDIKTLIKKVEELEEFVARTEGHLLGIVIYPKNEETKAITHWLFAGNLEVALDRICERFSDTIKKLEKDKK